MKPVWILWRPWSWVNWMFIIFSFIVFYGSICISVNATTDDKEISPIDQRKLLSIEENYTEEEKNVLTEKLVRNITSALKTEVKQSSKPERKPTTVRSRQLSSPSRRAILRGSFRARRQLENVCYCFSQPGSKISDPIKNQIETDLELSEEYTTNGRSKPSLPSCDRTVVFLQVKLQVDYLCHKESAKDKKCP